MSLTRRDWLRLVAGGAAGLLLPKKTFFLPPVGGWHLQRVTQDFEWWESGEINAVDVSTFDELLRKAYLPGLIEVFTSPQVKWMSIASVRKAYP